MLDMFSRGSSVTQMDPRHTCGFARWRTNARFILYNCKMKGQWSCERSCCGACDEIDASNPKFLLCVKLEPTCHVIDLIHIILKWGCKVVLFTRKVVSIQELIQICPKFVFSNLCFLIFPNNQRSLTFSSFYHQQTKGEGVFCKLKLK